MTGLLGLREMIKVVFSERKETGFNSRSLLNKFRSSLDRREQLRSTQKKTPQFKLLSTQTTYNVFVKLSKPVKCGSVTHKIFGTRRHLGLNAN